MQLYGKYYTYCTADTYCCHDNTESCNRLSVAQIIGIVCGVVAFIVKGVLCVCGVVAFIVKGVLCVCGVVAFIVKGVLCVCCCISKYRARAEMMRQPKQANVIYITTTGQTPTGYSTPPSYSHTQYGWQSPYPAYNHGQATTAKTNSLTD
ncbi:hypothetical protein DPMN_014628 [Dreissena polymorpha]|uniref:Cysteine and tyrosine-rich protein 1 n=1 Tax=Dreissena polymorpha TaxID=45954 RepID=A0A9D4N9Q4_DREPO|nr:hypothetical protein DPMN_014628 [Dreissena polymorpha]